VAALDEAMLISESQNLVFLNELVGAAPNTLPTTSLGETSDSSLVL